MNLVIAWLCLGSGMAAMLVALALIVRLQARTAKPDEPEPEMRAEGGDR